MKKSDKMKRCAEETMHNIRALTRHIRNVEDNCVLLGEALIMRGEIDLGRTLIANGYSHDISKFYGIEFDNLSSSTHNSTEETAKLKMRMAVQHHQKTNKHHPEAWSSGIKNMSDEYLAEFCCDVKARSEEFGTDLRQWINESATEKYGFTKDDEVYRKIMAYVDILCPKPFENLMK